MTTSMQASLTAIGRQLKADYSTTVGQPLPSDLKDLLARLVALEASTRGSTERSVESLTSATPQLRPRS